jgi:hypothetical protein
VIFSGDSINNNEINQENDAVGATPYCGMRE